MSPRMDLRTRQSWKRKRRERKERTFTQQVEKLSDHLLPQFPSRSAKESSHWQKPGIGAEEGMELTASY